LTLDNPINDETLSFPKYQAAKYWATVKGR